MIKRFVLCACMLAPWAIHAGENSMVVIQVRNLEKASSQVEALAEALELPVPPGLVKGQLGMLAMSPNMDGIDASSPITIFVEKFSVDQPAAPNIVIRFSVTGDGSDYLSSVEKQLPMSKELEPGVHKFYMGDADDPAAPSYFVSIADGLAAAGNDLDAVRLLEHDLDDETSSAFAVMPGEISASVNVAAFSEIIDSQLKQQKAMMEMYKAQMEAEGMDTSAMMKNDPMAGLEAVNDMMAKTLGQLDLLVLNLDVSGDITIRTHVRPVPGSVLAEIVADMTAPPVLISGQQMSDAWFRGYGTMSGFDRILEPYADWVASLYRQLGPPLDGFADQYRDMVLGMKGLYTGGFNMFILPPRDGKPLQLAGIYDIADKEKAMQAMRDVMKMQEDQGESMTTDMGYSMKVTSSTEESYKDVVIESYHISYDFTDEKISEEMPKSMDGLFKDMTYTIGCTDRHLVFSFGSVESVHQMIDYVLGGGAPVPVRDGFADVAEEALGYWNLSIGGMIKTITGMMPPELSGGPLATLQDMNASIRSLAIKEHGGFSSLLRLTKADLKDIITVAMSIAPRGPRASASFDDQGMMSGMPLDEETPAMDEADEPAE